MGLEKRTIKIIVIVAVVVIVIGGVIGLLLGLLLPRNYVVLEVWPRSEEYNWEQPLIQVRRNDAASWLQWYQRINEFLRPYETSIPEQPPRAPCSVHHRLDQHLRSDACDMAMKVWHPCTADERYGYEVGQPCVFLRLNHIHYWVPEPYNVTSNMPLPSDLPHHIRHAMNQLPAHQYGDFAWISCDGESSSDQENIGPIMYIPKGMPPGFPLTRLHTADRIPYQARNLPDQTPSPVLAVWFQNPKPGVVISVECRVWTRDLYLYYTPTTRYGRARFELMVE